MSTVIRIATEKFSYFQLVSLRPYRQHNSLLSPGQLTPELFCVLTVLYCIFVLMVLINHPDLDLE